MAKGRNSYIRKKDKNDLLKIKYCQYCGSTNNLCIDHYIPPSKGGDSSRQNLVRSCTSCNSSKSDRMPDNWIEHLASKQQRLSHELERVNKSIDYLIERKRFIINYE